MVYYSLVRSSWKNISKKNNTNSQKNIKTTNQKNNHHNQSSSNKSKSNNKCSNNRIIQFEDECPFGRCDSDSVDDTTYSVTEAESLSIFPPLHQQQQQYQHEHREHDEHHGHHEHHEQAMADPMVHPEEVFAMAEGNDPPQLQQPAVSGEELSPTAEAPVSPNNHNNNNNNKPVSLEGSLFVRKGRSAGASKTKGWWKRRYVVLNLMDGGSISVYQLSSCCSQAAPPDIASADADDNSSSNNNKNNSKSNNNSFRNNNNNNSMTHRSLLQSKLSVADCRRITDEGAAASCGAPATCASGDDNCDGSGDGSGFSGGASHSNVSLCLFIPPHYDWVAKDVANDHSTFVIEIPTGGVTVNDHTGDSNDDSDNASIDSILPPMNQQEGDTSSPAYASEFFSSEAESSHFAPSSSSSSLLQQEIIRARNKGKPLRIYFRCPRSANEKALWLKAFARIKRLSDLSRTKKTILAALSSTMHLAKKQRIRRPSSAAFARGERQLDLASDDESTSHHVDIHFNLDNDEELTHKKKRRRKQAQKKHKEYRVLPYHVYPHRWMTKPEIRDEMMAPSEKIIDLTLSSPPTQQQIGSLQVEVLQCVGLPKLDRTSETDAVVYCICGSHAFATDVIPNRANPMWLRKTRRACLFPLQHAYARLYVGVFHDGDKGNKDDFAGRVVVDVARLRPDSAYDVTLPLRLSTHVYSRRRRGAIRLRIKLSWLSQRKALLSYLPKNIRLPKNAKPKEDVTVLCADRRAFRNVAITVHGVHMPGRFTFQQLRATLREINFTTKMLMIIIRRTLKQTRQWDNPAISSFVFGAWMHCVYVNSFSLVPAYVLLFILLHFMRNYARHGMDNSNQHGFSPPSWEEMMLCLLFDQTETETNLFIQPLEMGFKPAFKTSSESNVELFNYEVSTHKNSGRLLFQLLGFHGTVDDSQDVGEFPFSNRSDYPRFTVKESLCTRRRDVRDFLTSGDGDGATGAAGHDYIGGNTNFAENHALSRNTDANDSEAAYENGIFPGIHLPSLDELPGMMAHKDESGMNEYDDEEENFAATRFFRQTGATQLSSAARNIKDSTRDLSYATGLHYVVSPIKDGLGYVVPPLRSGIVSSYNQVVPPITSGIMTGIHQLAAPIQQQRHLLRRSASESCLNHAFSSDAHAAMNQYNNMRNTYRTDYSNKNTLEDDADITSICSATSCTYRVEEQDLAVECDPRLKLPQQDIDLAARNPAKKLTDDIAEIKERMHSVFGHVFNDKTYTIKDPSACYFGHSKRTMEKEKQYRRRKQGERTEERKNPLSASSPKNTSRNLDKLLQVGQYSHSNPVVARVGLYVEPIIGAAHSVLSAFRALFNAFTWRDPFLSFWLSIFGMLLVFFLFIFPWRIFLFVMGLWVVGPQNYLFRVLRERGLIAPVIAIDEGKEINNDAVFCDDDEDDNAMTRKKQKTGSKIDKAVDGNDGHNNNNVKSDNSREMEQMIFRCHRSVHDEEYKNKERPSNPRELHHVVVPYSQLMYQRFYDWPPEPHYAQVRSDNNEKKKKIAHNNPVRKRPILGSPQASFRKQPTLKATTEVVTSSSCYAGVDDIDVPFDVAVPMFTATGTNEKNIVAASRRANVNSINTNLLDPQKSSQYEKKQQ